MNINLKNLINKHMGDMIPTHNFRLIEVQENEVLLKSTDYLIDIIADKDGVSTVYFDTSSSPPKGYNIFLFLINKRRNSLDFPTKKLQPQSYANFIESELRMLVQHLRSGGQDILSGSKDWIKTYSWPIIQADKNITSAI